jgi:hypothetical protein
MVKAHLTEGLSEGRCSKICFESVGVQHRDEGFDGVEWGTGFGQVTSNVTSTPGKDGVDCCNTVGWCLNFHVVDWLEKTRCGLSIRGWPTQGLKLLTRRKEE